MFTPQSLFGYIELVRAKSPLIHCITNQVASNFTANVLLAIGSTPAMVLAPEQVEEFVKVADSLSINLGTLNSEQRKSILLAVKAANELNKRWVLDPVGVSLTWTREFALELLKLRPTAIRGNASEVVTLAGGKITGRGPNFTINSIDALPYAKQLSNQIQCIICVTGETDLIVKGNVVVKLKNGHPVMTKVTALGCSLSSVVAAYLSVSKNEEDMFESVVAANSQIAIAGELVAKECDLPGTFAVKFLDKLSSLTLNDYRENLRLIE